MVIHDYREVPGFISDQEVELLQKYAREVPPVNAIVEIGTYCGKSTIAMACVTQQGTRIYTIDPHVQYEARDHLNDVHRGLFPGTSKQKLLYKHITESDTGEVISVIVLKSEEAAAAWGVKKQPIHLLWIDGDHNYASVVKDIMLWKNFLTPDGHIILHDVDDPAFPGIRKAINQIKSLIYVEHVGAAHVFSI